MDRQCLKNYLQMILNGKKSTFNENLIKNYDENSDKGYILELDLKNPKWLHNLHNVLPFYLTE